MKTGTLKSKKILAVCAVERNVAIYDCATEERLMTLSTGFQNNTIRNIATCGTSVLYCCDSNKRVFTFDLANERPLMRIDDRKLAFSTLRFRFRDFLSLQFLQLL